MLEPAENTSSDAPNIGESGHPVNSQSENARSLDLVQRLVATALLVVIAGGPIAALAIYSPRLAATDLTSAVGLCVMCGVIGLVAMSAILILHRRFRPSHLPLLAIGVVPAVVAALIMATS